MSLGPRQPSCIRPPRAKGGGGVLRTTWRWFSRVLLAVSLLWCIGLLVYWPWYIAATAPAAIGCLVYRYSTGRWSPSTLWLWVLVLMLCLEYWSTLPPQAEWQTPWAVAPNPQFKEDGATLIVEKVRDFRYRAEEDYDVVYLRESYDMDKLEGLAFVESHWDGMEAICHTMLDFSFTDGEHLVVSPETRLPVGKEQNAVAGLYKQYGLLYVFGTEEDLLALRTDYRHEDLLYMPLDVSKGQAQGILRGIVEKAQDAEKHGTPYNTLVRNCSTGILGALAGAELPLPRGYKLLPVHNGAISRVLYDHGLLRTEPGEGYNELRRRCYLRHDLAPGRREDYARTLRERIQP